MNDPTFVVLVGGRGLAMGERTAGRQKLMLDVDGKPVVAHLLDGIADTFGGGRVLLSTGYRPEDVRSWFGDMHRGVRLEYVHDREIRGTLWGVVLARRMTDGPVVFLGGDVLVEPAHVRRVASSFDASRGGRYMGVLSGATRHEPAIRHAIIRADEGRVTYYEPVPRPDCAPNEYRDLHMGVFRPELLEYLEGRTGTHEAIEYALQDAVRDGFELDFVPYEGTWYHFKRPEDFDVRIQF